MLEKQYGVFFKPKLKTLGRNIPSGEIKAAYRLAFSVTTHEVYRQNELRDAYLLDALLNVRYRVRVVFVIRFSL